MIPVYLRLTNFMSHVNSEISFNELDPVTLIVGTKEGNPKRSNGAGKSSIFDAITWALYEKSRASGNEATNIDSIVRGKAEKCEVEFQFNIGEDLYRVVRSRDRKKRKSDVSFQIRSKSGKWLPVGADSKGETKLCIVKTLGMDYGVFENSALLKQHEAAAFAEMTPGERKEVITKILQLNYYDEFVAQAKKRLEKLDSQVLEDDIFLQSNLSVDSEKEATEREILLIKEKIEVYQKRIESLRSIIEKLRDKQAEEGRKIKTAQDLLVQYEKIKERIQKNIISLKEFNEAVKRCEADIEKIKASLKQKQERVIQIKQERGDPSVLKREIEEWTQKVKDFTEKKTSLLVESETSKQQVKTLSDESSRVRNLAEGVCSSCYQAITEGSKEAALSVFEAKLKLLHEKHIKARDLFKEADAALAEAQRRQIEVQSKRELFNRLQQEGRTLLEVMGVEKNNLEMQVRMLEDNQSLKRSSSESLTAAQNELAVHLEKIEEVGKVDETKFQDLSRQIKEKNVELELTQSGIGELQVKIGGLQERLNRQKQILEKVQLLKEQRTKLNHDRRIEKELINAFGKTGIQALILENSATEIEKISNDLLSQLTNGAIGVKIQTQRANQDGSLKEVFDIVVTDEYHSSPFNMYSGGEKFRIAFVIRVALSILLTRRAGVRIGAIFYDEAFQDLDDDGIDKMVEVFKLLSSDFRYQLVVSHSSELKNQFRDIIIVNKTSAGSFVSKK